MSSATDEQPRKRGTSPARRRRGADTQRVVAESWRARGWPYAEPVGAGSPGRDITGVPGIALEVKARADFSPLAWMRQADRNSRGELSAVVLRPNGAGPGSVDQWPVILAQGAFQALLRAAGYGADA